MKKQEPHPEQARTAFLTPAITNNPNSSCNHDDGGDGDSDSADMATETKGHSQPSTTIAPPPSFLPVPHKQPKPFILKKSAAVRLTQPLSDTELDDSMKDKRPVECPLQQQDTLPSSLPVRHKQPQPYILKKSTAIRLTQPLSDTEMHEDMEDLNVEDKPQFECSLQQQDMKTTTALSSQTVIITSNTSQTVNGNILPAALSKADRSTFRSNLTRLLQQQEELNTNFYLLFTPQEKETMVNDLNMDFTETVIAQLGQGKGIVEANLAAANHIMAEFWAVSTGVESKSSIIRMPRANQDIIFEALDSFLYPRLLVLYEDDVNQSGNDNNRNNNKDAISPKDAVDLLSWIDQFWTRLYTHMPRQLQLVAHWKQDMMRLSNFYLNMAVRSGMKEFLKRAWELYKEDDIREDRDGHVLTGLPEQVAYMYRQQLKTAQKFVPSSVMSARALRHKVVYICNQEMDRLVGDMQLKVASEWKEISTVFFCAIINDANRLAEQCEDRNERCLLSSDVPESEDNDDEDQEEELEQSNLTELALYATDCLCQHIMVRLCHPLNDVLTSVGDQSWEQDESCMVMDLIIETLKDYFNDVKVWLQAEYFYLKVLRTCFTYMIQIYLESFFGNTISDGVKNPQAVAEQLHRDYLRLVVFFNGPSFEKYYQQASAASASDNLFFSPVTVNESLRTLQNMAAIVSPENPPESVQGEIKALLQRFDQQNDAGSAAVLHLAGLRKRHSKAESLVWVKVIASARKAIASEKEVDNVPVNHTDSDSAPADKDGASAVARNESRKTTNNSNSGISAVTVPIPDIRNSRYIRNIRKPTKLQRQSILERDMSMATLSHAQSTLQLLEGPSTMTKKITQGPLALFEKASNMTNTFISSTSTNIKATTTIVTKAMNNSISTSTSISSFSPSSSDDSRMSNKNE